MTLKWEPSTAKNSTNSAEDHLSELLLAGELQMGQSLKVGVKAGQLEFEVL